MTDLEIRSGRSRTAYLEWADVPQANQGLGYLPSLNAHILKEVYLPNFAQSHLDRSIMCVTFILKIGHHSVAAQQFILSVIFILYV